MNDTIIDLPATVPQQTAVTRVQDNAMGVADILAQVRLIQEVMGKVMIANEHYGKIPGCGDKMTLLQPGAQKLCMTFRLAPEYQIQETNFPGGHKEYRVICTLKSISIGAFVGQGVGCCSTLESKYRWRAGARKCPECGKETIIKGKAEYGSGWLCFAKKGGCGAKWTDDSEVGEQFASANVERVEHDSPADFYNTVLKMAKKRAFVDATITATAASDIFTQDIGDDEEETAPEQAPKTPQDAPGSRAPRTPAKAPKAAAAPKSATEAPITAKKETEAQWSKFLASCKARLLELVDPDKEWAWWRYAGGQDWILPTESLADARAEKIFEGFDRKNTKESINAIFEKHNKAVAAIAASCSVEMREEILHGLVPMPTILDVAPQKSAMPKANCCPACNSTTTKTHDDLVGVIWCKKCGTQWQDSDPDKEPYEEHGWMFAKLPFAPKDPEKPYKGMTLGQIARLDSKYWFGIVMNFKAEPFQGRPPSQASVAFGEACEKARANLEEQKSQTDREEINPRGPDDDSDVPF